MPRHSDYTDELADEGRPPEPRIAGTRISVYSVQRLAEDGFTIERILREYPSLRKEDVEEALKFQISAKRDLEIRRSLERAVRKIKFRLFIRREFLRVELFVAEVRGVFLRARCYVARSMNR